MDRMNRETVLCADTDRLCDRGFPIGDGNRGHDVRVGQTVEGYLPASSTS